MGFGGMPLIFWAEVGLAILGAAAVGYILATLDCNDFGSCLGAIITKLPGLIWLWFKTWFGFLFGLVKKIAA